MYFLILLVFPITSNCENEEEMTNATSNNELEKAISNIWYQLIHKDRFSFRENKLKQMTPIANERISPSTSVSMKSSQMEDTNVISDETQQNDELPISSTTSFFSLGGDSLPLLQLYRHYQSIFNFDTEKLSVRTFFEHDTIAEHAELLKTIRKVDIQSKQWYTLNINQSNQFNYQICKIR